MKQLSPCVSSPCSLWRVGPHPGAVIITSTTVPAPGSGSCTQECKVSQQWHHHRHRHVTWQGHLLCIPVSPPGAARKMCAPRPQVHVIRMLPFKHVRAFSRSAGGKKLSEPPTRPPRTGLRPGTRHAVPPRPTAVPGYLLVFLRSSTRPCWQHLLQRRVMVGPLFLSSYMAVILHLFV